MAQTSEGETLSAVIDKAFQETLDLLIEARNYAAYSPAAGAAGAGGDADGPGVGAGVAVTGSHLRVTSRLSGVMAWLLYRKAVTAGEIDEAETLRDLPRLDAVGACLDDRHDRDPGLPEALRDLLARSRRLYLRVARLDAMIREADAGRRRT